MADPKNPVAFHLRKKGPPSNAIHREIEIVLPWEPGSTVRLNLLTGKVSDDGQMEIKAWKNSRNISAVPAGTFFPRKRSVASIDAISEMFNA